MTLEVPEGVFWGILGPNGAGKTTLLSILVNLITAEKGLVRVLGVDMKDHAGTVKDRINLSSGHANFPWSMTVQENLNYYAMLYGLSGKARKRKVEELIGIFDLGDFARVPFDGLSTGTKQKLSLAKSLINDPELLLLDEPTVGLDPDVARRVRESILHIHKEKGTTIIMTTHNMKEAEILCQKLVFIKDGLVKAFGMPLDLKQELRLGDRITIFFDATGPSPSFNGLEGIYEFEQGAGYCRIVVDNHRERLPGILDLCVLSGIRIKNLTIQEVDLEDVFISLAR
ncbi:MAG: ABC transporter ATP-binding protein [Deltaproteobacteria bacterium]|nr:ABC transporter ATP-binding protein [Deltaproteobacteria bacterium]